MSDTKQKIDQARALLRLAQGLELTPRDVALIDQARAELANPSGVFAEARKALDGTWFVFWETDAAYGARGEHLTQEGAEDLARRLREGQEKP